MLKASLQLYRNAYTGLPPKVWWLSFVIFVNRAGTMVIPFLTVYLLGKGFSLAQAGYIMGAFGLGTILGSFLGGRLTDRFHFFHVQLYSLLLNGILFIVLGQMQTFLQFMVCIFVLSSLGESFRPANAAAIAAYSDESNRTRSYSLNRLAINLGWSIGPAVGGILAAINYHLLFWVDGFTCIVASLLLYIFLKPGPLPKKDPEKAKLTGGPSAFRDKTFLKGMVYIFLVGFCFFQLFSIIPVYYKSVLNLNEATIGWLLALNGIIIVLVEMVLVYKLESRGRMYEYMFAGAALIGLSFLILNVSHLMVIVLASIILVTFGEMLLFPFINNFWVQRSRENNRGEYASVYTMAFAVANVLAPTLAAQLATAGGFPTLWLVNCVVCMVAAAGFILLKPKHA